ncbi:MULTISPECIES: rhomboid family intramembrane serine protease [Flavobacterium]|uniref:Rhomboid family intramembrane serine protease n=2 Tax=Flavobacterium TaxID=237 RepID=A0AA94F3J4_9FLAO|nr:MULTISPECIES: rhomboid family intramembrane serine protease [Flavobacterium]OXA78343.1 rhomboid family intramembrane serine protease [Flavobacterium columnare NBRC 100251 = ATCC 23463]AMA49455.1 rhomboid family intramembrane serine protease [Flavobacterium covae]AND63149.1 rhomboid family intramembrane serine protease [Flavobacterium covae]MCH4828726.1 rhomboid family intramembrane serine protease [Flavobacterium columnare]MCH4831980.1 rhomboid family intramembrane serine protease [Flavobac
MIQITPTVKQLLIINVICFIGTYLVQHSNSILALYYFENTNFRPWQLLTYMFIHGNFIHILFNMFALYSFGTALEHFWGAKKFLFFYISCGIGAGLIHSGVNYIHFQEGLNLLLENGEKKIEIFEILKEGKYKLAWEEILTQQELTSFISTYLSRAVGASGAIYGLLTAFAFMFPNAELMMMFIPVPIKAKYFVPIVVGLDLFSGVTGSSIFGGNIAHFAHVGGALIGFLMMWYWKKNSFNDKRWN